MDEIKELQTYTLSVYPGEFALVKSHKSNGGEQWYRREDVDPLISRLERAERELNNIQQEEVRRIKHLNRLATWAQQDPTGPIVASQIQEWVLNELGAALGAHYKPTSWRPESHQFENLQEQLAAERTAREQAEAKLEAIIP